MECSKAGLWRPKAALGSPWTRQVTRGNFDGQPQELRRQPGTAALGDPRKPWNVPARPWNTLGAKPWHQGCLHLGASALQPPKVALGGAELRWTSQGNPAVSQRNPGGGDRTASGRPKGTIQDGFGSSQGGPAVSRKAAQCPVLPRRVAREPWDVQRTPWKVPGQPLGRSREALGSSRGALGRSRLAWEV